ncbi:MAG: hypothetical protein P8R54_01540 [Myxococcota bacterium]|nr:hypothetical protein [Myxococcota bacterium]
MLRRFFTAWAVLGLTALTATAVGWRSPPGETPGAPSLAPASFRIPPADVSTANLLTASTVSLADLIDALEHEAQDVENSEVIAADFHRLAEAHNLPQTNALRSDYVRVKLAFEATRDAGWWYLRRTHAETTPSSQGIWEQWAKWPGGHPIQSSATADSSALSAMFAFLVCHLGVAEVGLFYPTPDHTVAAWSPSETARLVVPTTQLFLSSSARLGTAEMDPFTQRNINRYTHRDVADSFTIPGDLAAFFQLQVRRYLSASEETLQETRSLRARSLHENWSVDEAHVAIDFLQSQIRSQSTFSVDMEAIDRLRIELTASRSKR